ncbi:MAG: glycerate dehydrogenase [Treponema sp. CETP13]|nr:MAG: glycerate dehydrogenase [Treponema sp. CETP13]
MKIVVLDGYSLNPGDISWAKLEELGDLTIYDRTLNKADIIPRIGDAEIVLMNKTPITKETLTACKNIKYIGVLATGYNVVDIDAAKEKGIPVCNIPNYGTNAVAQFATGLLLELCHHIGEHSHSVYKGEWENSIEWCYWHSPLIELSGKTAGIIGFGRIGKRTAEIFSALGLKIIVYTPHPKKIDNSNFEFVSLEDLLKRSDVISLHCPLTKENEGLINKDTIAKMKKGVLVINTSRGPLINENDLAEALNSGKIGGAACDVVSVEPINKENPLLKAKNCILTPHIAWAAKETRERLLDIGVNNVKAFLNNSIINQV